MRSRGSAGFLRRTGADMLDRGEAKPQTHSVIFNSFAFHERLAGRD